MAGFNHTVSAILRGSWLIDTQWANAHLPLFLSMLKGESVGAYSLNNLVSNNKHLPYIVHPSGKTEPLYLTDEKEGITYNNKTSPQNSVGVLSITGPITKYDGDCGVAGSMSFAETLKDFNQDPNIGSVVLILDTPGGESRAAYDVIHQLSKMNKPVLSFVHGMNASLGMWYSAATTETYLSNDLDQMGSIGSYCSFFDYSNMMESMGIKLHEVYAPQSTDKNKSFRDAMQGDYTALQNELKLSVDKFIQHVANRSDKAKKYQKEWETGKMFFAQDAIKFGLADGIMSLYKVISRAAFIAKKNKS